MCYVCYSVLFVANCNCYSTRNDESSAFFCSSCVNGWLQLIIYQACSFFFFLFFVRRAISILVHALLVYVETVRLLLYKYMISFDDSEMPAIDYY